MLKGAIVGFGEIARHGHWPAYLSNPSAEIVAVVDRTSARRSVAEQLKPGLKAFETLDELAASMSIDFVDICTPPSLHPEPMLEAIKRGWHVLCEKPFLLDQAVLDLVRREADRRTVAVVPVDNWKYAPIVRAATDALAAGAVGALTRVEIEVVRLQAAPIAEVGVPNWRRDPAIAGGGIAMDHGWHAVYLVLNWFRARASTVRSVLHRPPASTVEDEASIFLGFPSGEATIFLTWNGSERRNTIRLAGTQGEILIADDELHVRGRESRSTTFPSRLSGGSHHDDWFAAMLPEVIACFHDPARAHDRFEEAAECLSILGQVYAAGAVDEASAVRMI